MMKNMDPSQMKEMVEQAREAQRMLDEQIKKAVAQEIEERDLVSREEVQKMIDATKETKRGWL